MLNALVNARSAALLVVGAALLVTPAAGQTYKSDDYDRSLASKGALVKRYVRDPNSDPEGKQQLETYLDRYYFPAMTQHTDKGLESLGRLRTDLFKGFLWVADGPTYRTIYDKALRFAVRVLKGSSYHPSVRYNALLVLGMLDSQPAGEGIAPTPDERANGFMCQLASRAAKDARRPRYELAGSLVGLERHTRLFNQLSSDAKKRTLSTLVGILRQDELAGEYQRGVRPWVYSLAAQSLGNAGLAGPNGVCFQAIAKRAGDTKLGTKNRARIAAQLDRLGTDGVTIDATAAAAAIKELAAEIGRREAKLATQFEDLRLGGRGGRRAGQAIVQTRNKTSHRFRPTENGYELVRQGLVDLLTDLRAGVQAIARIAGEADRPSLTEVEAAVDAALRAAGNEDEGDLKVADAVKSMSNRIARAVNPEEAENEADEFAAR